MGKYYIYNVKKVLSITNLITLEYLSIDDTFSYAAEKHGFYEFAYVDNGKLNVVIDGIPEIISQGEAYFIKSGTEHHYSSIKNQTASIFIACFSSASYILSSLSGKTVFDKLEIKLVAEILNEARNAFVFPFNRKLEPLAVQLFGAQQIVEHEMEILFINMIRKKLPSNSDIKFVMNSIEFEDDIVNDILACLKKNVYGQISLNEICKKFFYSKVYLNKVFKKNVGKPIKNYYNHLKVEEAKILLKSEIPIKEIAEKLCFDTPNYFTKIFKKATGLTPSEYKNSISS